MMQKRSAGPSNLVAMAERQESRGHLDLAGQLTDRVEDFVDLLRNRSAKPILTIARVVVIGAVVALSGTVAAIVIVIALLRLFDKDVFGGRVWATYFLFGAIFAGAGLLLLAKSSLKGSDDAN